MADGVSAPVKVEAIKSKVTAFEHVKQMTDGIFRKLLAIVVLYFVLDFLFETGTKAFDQQKWDILLMILTAFLNLISALFGFYYASTQSSQDKDKRIDKIVNGEE